MEKLIINILAYVGLFGGGYFLLINFLKHLEKSKLQDEKEIELIKNSPECIELGEDNNLTINSLLAIPKYKKELLKMIRNPEIRNIALEKIKEKRAYEQSERQENFKKRKIGYKYENEIFGSYYKLTQNEIIEGLMKKFSISKTSAYEIFEECKNNWLINKVNTFLPEEEVFYTVGPVLILDKFKLIPSDLTWKEWLKKNNKELRFRVNMENDLPF